MNSEGTVSSLSLAAKAARDEAMQAAVTEKALAMMSARDLFLVAHAPHKLVRISFKFFQAIE